MPSAAAIDQIGFRRILIRNITLPLAVGVTSAAIFVALIFYLLSVLNWVEHSERVIGNANEATKLSVDMESGIRGYVITGDVSFLASYELAKPRIASEMKTLGDLVRDNPQQVERLQRIAAMQAQWMEFAQTVIRMRRNNEDYRGYVSSGAGKLQFDEIRREFTDFLQMERRLRQERSEEARNVTALVVGIYLLISILLSGLLAFWGRRELMRLSATYNDALTQHQLHATSLEKLAWQRAGQAKLGEQGIGQMALPVLGRAVLDFLSQYVNATVSALYAREDNGILHRVASYGFSKENEHSAQSFNPGESLVGQAAATKRVIHLDDVPDNYLKVTSGLGDAKPRHIVLLPINHDGDVNGVVELGFLEAPSARDLEFLQLVAPYLGSAVEAALYRRRLQDVLAETQQLNEELQVQQEELRTANEELEEQSRILEESQVNLENQKAELEQTNEQLANQAVSLDEKNAALNEVQGELEERALELQRASKYKSEFLANMSHELRTPLNSSLILSKLLADNQKGNLDEEQIKFANTIYSAGNDLLSLINDILDISKVEAGKLDLAPEDIQVSHLIEGLKATFEPLAGQKQLQLTTKIEATAPQTMFVDRQRVEQIIKNLLSNAIKFTEAGHVTLTVTANQDGHIAFAVSDSGIGISTDQQESIFEAFRQADGTTSRRYGGTGLGLSISRDLAALLGGSISICSTPGKGSTFTLLLPTKAPSITPVITHSTLNAPPSVAPPPTPIPLSVVVPSFPDDRGSDKHSARTVLVIEDEVAFARILYDLAHEMQYRCLVAHGTVDGLNTAETYVPDAILLDMGLPDGSGMSLLQQLKTNPTTRHIPVHIVSGSDRTEAALQMGAIGYVIKPTTRDQLKEVFQKLESKFSQKMKRILLVEDDARQRDAVVQLISDDDVEITAVASGEEAMTLLRDTIFDCMIIDLKLPDIQGEELLQKMASEDITSFPPVIVYTGRNLTREEEANLLKYSRSIIIKGARSPERLLDEVTLFLHKVESELSTERQSMLKTLRSRDRVFEGRRILIVDDDIRNIFALTSALEQKGAVIEIGRNGFEAIEKLDQVPEIDLVLMDVMMPGMDGLEATRRIRADPRFTKLPIIAITAKAMKDDQEQCLQAGTSDYLAKPIDLDRLYSLVRVWMPNMERL